MVSPKTPSILPRTGDIVTAKVMVVNPRMVQCVILCVGPSALARPYRGILKKEDIKATDKDRIDPYKCFRPGDIILARVVSFLNKHCNGFIYFFGRLLPVKNIPDSILLS